MPILILGVAAFAALLLLKKTPAQIAADAKAAKDAEVKRITAEALATAKKISADAVSKQEKSLATGLGIATTGVGLAGAIIGKIGVSGAATAAAAGGTAAAAGGTTAAAGGTAGIAVATGGAVAGGFAAAPVIAIVGFVICVIAALVAIGMGIANVVESFADMANAAARGPETIRGGFDASMRRSYEKFKSEMRARVPAQHWGSAQGLVQNTALLCTIHMHRRLNELYRAGALANAKDIFATQEQHEQFWADHGAFIPDFEAFADIWIAGIGAGSRRAVIQAATLAAGGADKLNALLLKAETAGKLIFYYTATSNNPILGVTDESGQAGWINRFAISNPIAQRWPVGGGSPFGIFGFNLQMAVVASKNGWNPQSLLALIHETWDLKEACLTFDPSQSKMLYQENGLLIDLVASAQLKQPVIIDVTGGAEAIAQQVNAYASALAGV